MTQVVLITGSSTGFGRLTAETLARRGYRVFATMRETAGRNAPARAELERIASGNNLSLEVLEMDVTSDASVDACITQALSRAGNIDIVINNAAMGASGLAEAFTADEFRTVFETNFLGVVRVNRAVLPAMRRQRKGLLLHVSSAGGRVVVPYNAPYCASKFALESLADTYRYELAPFGIDSVLVEPGAFRTTIFQRTFPPADTARSAEYEHADLSSRLNHAIEKVLSDTAATDPAEVVSAMVRLIELPAGQRPLRTIIGAAVQGITPYNELAEKYREGLARAFGLEELLTPSKGGAKAEA
ncbi:MAG: SDR family oxidoreductase [Acidobacteriaceae bacterium]|nr:SDR family oxidoreductase [Acidobacteriaceae bacterium]